MKRCCRCKKKKSLVDFPFRNKKKNKRRGYCKECRNLYSAEYYKKNSEIQKKRVKVWKEKNKRFLKKFIKNEKKKPCQRCGKKYSYYVMDFDHVRGRKKNTISNMVRKQRSLKEIQKEIAKCELVCSNCHRMRTYRNPERGKYKK